jgi:hypothetical protein
MKGGKWAAEYSPSTIPQFSPVQGPYANLIH